MSVVDVTWAMGNPELHEMIDLPAAGHLLQTVAIVLLAAAVVLVVVGLGRGRKGAGALRWAGALAPWVVLLTYGWQVFLWRVGFDPETGFLGLESVRVLAENAVFALVLGVAYGVYLRWLWSLPEGSSAGNSTSQED